MKRLKVCRSKIHGTGILLTEPVKKGKTISYIRGKIRRLKIKNLKDSLSHSCWIGVGKEVWIDPGYPFRYLNHSCEPTAGVKGKVTLVALKDLKPGEEVTVDYSLIEGDPAWFMNCQCGNKSCRRVIRSVEFLPPKTFKSYLPYIPSYFKGVYKKHYPKLKVN